ncbi:hypothetical protein ACWD8I_20555 [Micromonospora arida]|uniref:hypothetical protein n=1 Tax=Micromonospora arida TaxID=2203715 RepID=UPI0033BECEEB
MMVVVFDDDREWYIQGRVFESIVECVPAGMLQDDDLVMHLRPARAVGLLNLPRMDPDRAERIGAALNEGVKELAEFYQGLLTISARRVEND